jgi:RNA polymerase sigma-70 factor (ECF subfamily)
MSDPTQDLLATRWTLLGRLKDWDDEQSWREFFDTYWRLIYSVAIKAGLTEAEAQDVVQDTIISVARKIGEFKCDPEAGSFKAWLLRLTRWRILNQLTKRLPTKAPPGSGPARGAEPSTPPAHRRDADPRTATIERVPDPAGFDLDAVWDAEWEQHVLETARERVKQKVSAQQFQIYELLVTQGWPVRKVAQLLNVSAGQVYLARHRVGALLKKELKKLAEGSERG